MGKLVKGGLCALALVCAFGLGQGGNGYTENDLALAREEAYNSGYHTGYAEGLTAQQADLYEEAFAAGRTEGYDTGFSAGYAQKETDAQAAREQDLASLTPIFPPVAPSDSLGAISPAQPDTDQPQQMTVYITNSGTKYHLDGCRHLKSKVEKTLEEAKALKLEPCKVCNPPK